MDSNNEDWLKTMKLELQSLSDNGVCELVELLARCKLIGCKWVCEAKKKADGEIERYKARLVANGFTQKEGKYYNETFSLVSTSDSFRVIMALVAHFNLLLHQMDVKVAFFNGDLVGEFT